MCTFKRGLLCATMLSVFSFPAYAETLVVPVPIGKSTLTVPGVAQAAQELRKIPGGSDVVPAEEFKQNTYALSFKDALAATPGVLAEQRYAEESRLSIRGSGLSKGFHMRGLALLQDGIPFHFADGSSDFQEADMLALQHIEVYRGGQALRYGTAGLGGAVNLVTPSARTLDYQMQVRMEGGSFGTGRVHIDGGQRVGRGDAYASLTKSVVDGYRAQTEQNNTKFNGNIGYAWNPRVESRFYVSWNDIEQEVPGTLTKTQALRTPKMAPASNIVNDNARDVRSLRVAHKTVVALEGAGRVELGGYVNDKDLYHPIFQVIDQESIDLGGFARYSTAWAWGEHLNESVIGLNVGRGVNNADRFVNSGGHRGRQTADSRQIAENYELYGENRFHLSRDWQLITGLQARLAQRDYEDHANAANDADKTFRSVNPKFGVMWQALPEAEIFAGLSKSTEDPTFNELVQGAVVGFVPVAPQRAWTAEVGSRGRVESDAGAFAWDVTLYRAWIKDEMLQYSLGANVPAATFNAGDTVHQGVELGASYQPWAWLDLSAVYNLNDFYFEGDRQFGDNQIAGAPPHQFQFTARYNGRYAGGTFHVAPHVEWVPEAAWVDFANTMKADAYVTLGLKAGWQPTAHINLFVDARNLTDERYIPTFSTVADARRDATNVFYPAEGRALYMGISVKF